MPDTQPLASIVITTCDRPEVVARAVTSALAQSERRVEVLVVDDGDRFPYQPRHADPRLRVHRTTGCESVNRARNLGLRHARANWVTFLDDDDELLPAAVEVCLAAVRGSRLPPPVAVLAGLEEREPDGRHRRTLLPVSVPRGRDYHFDEPDPDARNGLTAYNTLFAPTAIVREIGGFDEAFTAYMHSDLFLRLNRRLSFQAVEQVSYRKHHHAAGRLSTHYAARAGGMARLYRKHRAVFARHPQDAARHLALTSWTFILGHRWVDGAHYGLLAYLADPRRPRAFRQLLLALAGPGVALPLKGHPERLAA